MKVFQGTGIQVNTLSIILNTAYGFPARGTQKAGVLPASVPATWNQTGATPPGWTKKAQATYTATALDAWIPFSDADVALIAASPAVSVPDKATAAADALLRVDVPDITDGGLRGET